jgi:hypothetical protein
VNSTMGRWLAPLDRLQVGALERHLDPGREVVLAGQPGREIRGRIHVDPDLDPVGVREALTEVARVPHEGQAHVGLVALEHPGPGADDRFRPLEHALLVRRLAGQDVGEGGAVEEPGKGLLHGDAHRVAVHCLHLVDLLEGGAVGVARDGHGPLEREGHVLGGHLPPVHRRLVVPPDTLAQLEDIGRLGRLLPGLGEVSLDGQRSRGNARPRLVPDQAAVGQREIDEGPPVDVLVGIEVGRVEPDEPEHAAALRRLGGGRPGPREVGDRDSAAGDDA